MDRPLWITLEGGDGAGKGVAGGVVRRIFEEREIPYVRTREPGGTPEGEQLRSMLLGESGGVWEKTSEIMLMTTSRVQHVARVIRPRLAAGVSILCDRYVHSTIAYQGYGHQGPIDFIHRLHRETVGGDMPDLTIILDVDPEVGVARAKRRLAETGEDEGRMEGLAMEFHQRVRRGYLSFATTDPGRHLVIDASRTIPEVERDVAARFVEWLDAQAGWRPWHGRYDRARNGPDVADATTVMVRRRDGRVDGPYPAGRIEWHHHDVPSDVLYYRLVTEA